MTWIVTHRLTRRFGAAFVALGSIAAMFVACQSGAGRASRPAAPGASFAQAEEVGKIVRSRDGVVVSGSPLASRAGLRILERGGNAVDAAVATAFALAVVEPSMSGLGGRTQMIVRTADGEIVGYDGTTQVPASYHPASGTQERLTSGYGMIAIPGSLLTLATVLREHGTMPLTEVMAPAIGMAEAGIPTSAEEEKYVKENEGLFRPYPGSRQYFLKPDGTLYREGEWRVQEDLARTLKAIAASGPDAFYRGEIARRIAADMAANGGFLTTQDLAGYKVGRSRVVRGGYRGYELVGTYLPAAGAVTVEILQILESFDLARMEPAAWAAVVSQAILLGFEDLVEERGNPEDTIRQLLSKERAKAKAAKIRLPETTSWGPATGLGRLETVTASDNPIPEMGALTTHLSVADGRGGFVSSTQSLGLAMGSKVATPGLGFLWASTMGYLEASKPGDRAISAISPFIVLKDGNPLYIIGAAGGARSPWSSWRS